LSLQSWKKDVVGILEETWVTATGFPRKAKKAKVVREIAHMVRDPVEVDKKFLKFEGKVRVKVVCKYVTKVDGSTLLYINGQGHLLKLCSEKMEEYKKKHPQEFKSSSLDKDNDDSEDEGDNNEEFNGTHDSGFARLGENRKKRRRKES
jgi:hypothetical protein